MIASARFPLSIGQCFRRGAVGLLALLTAMLLAGCGPGIGGTGTGDDVGPADFGATDAPVCDSDLGKVLACPGGAPGTPANAGTAATEFASAAGATATRARFDGNAVQIDLLCRGQVFSGRFGVEGAAPGRYYGSLATPGEAVGSLAIAVIEPLEGGALRMRLLDVDDGLLWGPLDLQRLAPGTPAPSCK